MPCFASASEEVLERKELKNARDSRARKGATNTRDEISLHHEHCDTMKPAQVELTTPAPALHGFQLPDVASSTIAEQMMAE